mmetsp:Transcript_101126/g.285103  ORF Transcript_101126/g.285103 Transcript_101126/m.285103 type:complete len:316 (+) Transcript_101126:310-1257(+)
MKSHLSIKSVFTSTSSSAGSAGLSWSFVPSSAASVALGAAPPSSSESLLSSQAPLSPASPSSSESLLSSAASGSASSSESLLSSAAPPPPSSSLFSFPSSSSSSSSSAACGSPSFTERRWDSWTSSNITTSGFCLPSCCSFSHCLKRLYRTMSVSPNKVMGWFMSRNRSTTSVKPSGGSASSSSIMASASSASSSATLLSTAFLLPFTATFCANLSNCASSAAFCLSASSRWASKYSSFRLASASPRRTHFWPTSEIVFCAFACRSARADFSRSIDFILPLFPAIAPARRRRRRSDPRGDRGRRQRLVNRRGGAI